MDAQSGNDAARQVRNAYHRQWRKKNPERVKAAQDRYWQKKAKGLQEAERKQS